MSPPGHQDIERNQSNNHPEQPQSAWNQESLPLQREIIYGDSSGKFFSVYSRIAEEKDDKMTERWQKDADGMLVFAGLFSAAVAALLAVSIQDLRQNPQDTATFYLKNMYQVLADTNLPQASIPPPVINPPPFSPPTYAIWVNSLWFLSLVISLICALLATSLHQWARRYARVTQPARCSPEKRARMRAFFAGGVDEMRFPSVVEALPTLLHLSLFLFFSGLVIFLFHVNRGVYLSVVCCIGLCTAVYGTITFMPMFRPDSPYYTPLSTPASFLFVYTLKVIVIVVNVVLFCCVGIAAPIYAAVYFCVSWARIIIRPCTRLCCRKGVEDEDDQNAYSNYIWTKTCQQFAWFPDRLPSLMRFIWDAMLPRARGIWHIEKAAEQAISKRSSEIDLGILDWTLNALGEDDTLEEFFKSIPGFFNSLLVKVSKISTSPHYSELYIALRNALIGFLRRTLLSNSINNVVKNSRLDIYFDAMNAIYVPYHVDGALAAMIVQEFGQLTQSIETGRTLARWLTTDNQSIAIAAQYGIATILGAIKERDGHWIALAKKFGLPEQGLQDNINHGNDSVLLAIFLRMARQVFHTDPWNPEILSSLPKFDINKTRLQLRFEFCDLWNQIVLKKDVIYLNVLREIHPLYKTLHRGTGAPRPNILFAPSPYLQCNIATHYPNGTLPPPTLRDVPPHPSRSESRRIPFESTSAQPAGEVPIGSAFPSTAGSCPPPSQGPPSSSSLPITGPVHIALHITDPSTHQSLSTVDITAAMRPDEPTPAILITEMKETSQTPAETLPTATHSERVAVTPTPSVSVQRLDTNEQQDIAAPHTASRIARISSTANQVPLSTANIGATLQTIEESTDVPPAIVSGSLSSPIMTLAPRSSIIPVGPSSTVELASIQPGHVLHPLGSLSSPIAPAHPNATSQVALVLDPSITTSTGALGARERDETRDPSPANSMRVSLHEGQSEPSTRVIAEDALPHGSASSRGN